ncbi:MAG: nucleoside-triphosphatase [Desulfobacterales bacterium]
MRLRYAKTLITGYPGVGKTTLVQKIIKRMASVNMAGFCTSEIRGRGSRLGFELQGLNEGHRTLAHVEIKSQHRVAVPTAPQSGTLVVLTSTSHLAMRPSSVISPKSGALLRMAWIRSMPAPLRLVRMPRTELS